MHWSHLQSGLLLKLKKVSGNFRRLASAISSAGIGSSNKMTSSSDSETEGAANEIKFTYYLNLILYL